MNNEILKPTETTPPLSKENDSSFVIIDESQIASVVQLRKKILESLKQQLSLKAYYALEEKIAGEENRLKEILDIQQGKQRMLSKYTFILDPRYFEQEFLN